jgi:hypothetical protein
MQIAWFYITVIYSGLYMLPPFLILELINWIEGEGERGKLLRYGATAI